MNILRKKRIFIPFHHYQSIGGPSTFMQNLKFYLDQNGFNYSQSHKRAKSIFFPVSFDKTILNKIKNKHGKIIQRLDGIYYPSKHGDAYVELNKDIKDIYLVYADFVVFQSEYSKEQCFSMMGEKKGDEYTVILNGVNKTIFYPDEDRIGLDKSIQFVTTGNFRNIDMIEPLIKALDRLLGRFDFRLNIIGPVTHPEIEKMMDKDYIKLSGNKNLNEVASILRKSDIFLYSHLNPPCPNSVIEAISCGLPVVGFDSGAMSELLFFSKDLLAYVSDDIFQRYEDFDYRRLSDNICIAVENYEFYRKRSLEHSHLYSFEESGTKYLGCLKKIEPERSFIQKILRV